MMPREDKPFVRNNSDEKSPQRRRAVWGSKIGRSAVAQQDLLRIYDRSDIEAALRRGRFTVIRNGKKTSLRVRQAASGIIFVDAEGKRVNPVTDPGFRPVPPGTVDPVAQPPELSGVRRAKPVPRVPQPPGTEPLTPKGKPEKPKRRWFRKSD